VTTSPIHRDPAGGETVVPRSRPIRGAAVALGVAVLIAGGAYGATLGSGGGAPQARPTPMPSDVVVPGGRVMNDLNRTIRGLYGPRPQRAPQPQS
jgi:hypothetical protein